jgi:Ribbon-helix-helix protein
MAAETMTIQFPKVEKTLLEEFGKKCDLTLSQVVRRAIREFMLKEQIK